MEAFVLQFTVVMGSLLVHVGLLYPEEGKKIGEVMFHSMYTAPLVYLINNEL